MSDLKIGVCGHFGGTKEFLDGQTIKTKIVTEELKKQLSDVQILTVDTYGGIKALPRCLWKLFTFLCCCEHVIILPAYKSVRIFPPFLILLNCLFRKKLHYVVIGGWLPEFLKRKAMLQKCLKRFHYIYVETQSMKTALENDGFFNVIVMPNCKNLNIRTVEELNNQAIEQLNGQGDTVYKFCTFSRVLKEKGIEIAIDAMKLIHEKKSDLDIKLDIYGQVDEKYKDEFSKLRTSFPDNICYKGMISFDKSTEVLKEYYALLFPTFYQGEGFAGTLLDALAAGVPVIASDWKYNKEIVIPDKTGILLKECTAEKLAEEIVWIIENPKIWDEMRYACVEEAQHYTPEYVLKSLITHLRPFNDKSDINLGIGAEQD